MNGYTLSDYALTGRVTYQHSVIGMTLDGYKVKHTVQYIDIGKPAPITPIDPDAQMQPERFPVAGMAMALEGLQNAKVERFHALRDDVAACLREHGPASSVTITERLGNGAKERVLDVLRRNPQTFVFHGGQFAIWGLVGVPYTPPKPRKRLSATMLAARAALETYGPQSAAELAQRIGVGQTSVIKSIMARPEWFVVVEKRAASGSTPVTRVWGLVGRHDTR